MIRLFFIILTFLIAPSVSATEGTCSSHGGVNCSAGSDWDGSAVCKDGWRDSTENYYSVFECTDTKYPCTPEEFNQLEKDSKMLSIEEKNDILQKQLIPLNAKLNEIQIKLNEISSRVNKTDGNLLNRQTQDVNREAAIESLKITPEIPIVSAKISAIQSEIKANLNQYDYELNRITKICYLMGEYTYRKKEYDADMLRLKILQDNQAKLDNQANAVLTPIPAPAPTTFPALELSNIPTPDSLIVLATEKEKIINIDKNLSKRLKGKILIQVENRGEAWYVNPKNEKKYYMADGNEAYNIMRDLGVGVTNKDLEKIKTDKNFAKKHSGKIFLQVEDKGQAYYIDFEGNEHYLKDGGGAYKIMRELGLGITNNDIRKIDIEEIK